MNTITFTRKQLYDLVWADPLLTLSKKYNISDVGLRKVCIRMDIPLPKGGYWSKVKVGKPVDKKELPENYQGEQQIELSLRVEGESSIELELSPEMQLQKEIEQDIELNLSISSELVNPDTLIVNAQKSLSKKSDYYKVGDLLHTPSGQLDIRVSPEGVLRALCFMDTFIKAMKKRGHNFLINDKGSFLVIGEEEIQMFLKESQTKVVVKEKWERTELHANGIFTLRFEQIGTSVTAKDGKILIELQLAKIIARLEIFGERLKAETIKRKEWRENYERKKRIEEDFANRKKNELHGFKQLLQDSRRSHEVEILRNYINRVEQEAKSNGSLTDELQDWLKWARQKADWYDPLLETQDDWLKDVNQNRLLLENSINANLSQGYRYDYYSDRASSKPSWPLPWYKR